MNDALILILSVVGLFAVYWAIMGQWKYNRMMKPSDNEIVSAEYIQNDNNKN